MTTFTVSNAAGEMYSGPAEDVFDAVRKAHLAHSSEGPAHLQRARNPEWAVDWHVTSDDDPEGWYVRAARTDGD